MKQAICIVSVNLPGRGTIIAECDKSLAGARYPVYFALNRSTWSETVIQYADGDYLLPIAHNGDCPAALQAILERTDVDEIVTLHDTAVVRDLDLFRICFEECKGQSVMFAPQYRFMMGKYRRRVLEQITIPKVTTHREAWELGEIQLNQDYLRQAVKMGETVKLLTPSLDDTGRIEEKWGRTNKVFESPWLTKWCAHWQVEQLERTDAWLTSLNASSPASDLTR